jgi:hypothetical protein
VVPRLLGGTRGMHDTTAGAPARPWCVMHVGRVSYKQPPLSEAHDQPKRPARTLAIELTYTWLHRQSWPTATGCASVFGSGSQPVSGSSALCHTLKYDAFSSRLPRYPPLAPHPPQSVVTGSQPKFFLRQPRGMRPRPRSGQNGFRDGFASRPPATTATGPWRKGLADAAGSAIGQGLRRSTTPSRGGPHA